uniref:40S ribosomal protein S15a-2 n=1 Tax=Solanum tuberosum TaxID=4113 RepID=M0ZRB4_SOLTU
MSGPVGLYIAHFPLRPNQFFISNVSGLTDENGRKRSCARVLGVERRFYSRRRRNSKVKMGRRILNDALRTIVNAEKRGFASAELKPVSDVIANFLQIMKYRGYIKDFQVHDPHRVGKISVELLGRINDCRALTYRQDIKAATLEDYKTRTLPTRQWGYVVITTPNGVLDHEEAQRQNVGGQVLGYFY